MSRTPPKATIQSYTHTARNLREPQQPDPRPGRYYVSVSDGQRMALLAGPYPNHGAALEAVAEVRAKAIELDPWAHFFVYGTSRLHDNAPTVTGRLNEYVGMPT